MNLRDASQCEWDAIVVGAGPAGAVAARQLALAGARVLLVDKAPLGRWKVCGCCLNAAAVQSLASIYLDDILRTCGAVQLKTIRIAAGANRATLSVAGVTLSRQAFDAALIRAAISAGVTFLPNTQASLRPMASSYREVRLSSVDECARARTRLALAADGLGGSFLAQGCRHRQTVQRESLIGAGAIFDSIPDFIEPGTIFMVCSRSGYVGLVRLEDGQLNVAAALDQKRVRAAGGPGHLATRILAEAGWQIGEDSTNAKWRGTPLLTRRADQLALERVFLLGDAAGYVEPFTGEGMAWALASAIAITPLAMEAIRCWSPQLGHAWEQLHERTIARRQLTCRQVAWGLRHPSLVRVAVKVLSRHPQLALPVIRRLNEQ